jgi:hypothetical protein
MRANGDENTSLEMLQIRKIQKYAKPPTLGILYIID